MNENESTGSQNTQRRARQRWKENGAENTNIYKHKILKQSKT